MHQWRYTVWGGGISRPNFTSVCPG